MKQVLVVTLLFLLFSCSEDKPTLDLSNVTLTSKVDELSDGSLEYWVFEVEQGNLRRVNKKSPLSDYSFGLTTYTNGRGTPIGVALASLTSDLEFVNLSEFEFEEISTFPDSLARVSMGVLVSENDIIGIVSKSKRLKLKISTATFSLDDSNTPQSQVVFSAEYL